MWSAYAGIARSKKIQAEMGKSKFQKMWRQKVMRFGAEKLKVPFAICDDVQERFANAHRRAIAD